MLELFEEMIVEKFKKYVSGGYDMDDENISRKYFHSLRVMDFAKQIAISEDLSKHDIKVATVIGILHDYARFEQWKLYGTYSDVDSIEHGDLGVSLLFDKGEINNFYKDENDFNKIKLAIKYHNKISVPEDIVGDERVMCNIARDADKLDIFHLLIENKSLFMEDDAAISKEVRECFFKDKMINYKDIKSKNDKIVLSLAMFYDINFTYSYKYIIDTKILDGLYEHVEDKERFKEYFDHLKKVIDESAGLYNNLR